MGSLRVGCKCGPTGGSGLALGKLYQFLNSVHPLLHLLLHFYHLKGIIFRQLLQFKFIPFFLLFDSFLQFLLFHDAILYSFPQFTQVQPVSALLIIFSYLQPQFFQFALLFLQFTLVLPEFGRQSLDLSV